MIPNMAGVYSVIDIMQYCSPRFTKRLKAAGFRLSPYGSYYHPKHWVVKPGKATFYEAYAHKTQQALQWVDNDIWPYYTGSTPPAGHVTKACVYSCKKYKVLASI